MLGAALIEQVSVKPVLPQLGLPAEAPSLAPAPGPPLGDIDQRLALDLSPPAPLPEDEFDQLVSR